jgi:predicted dehydrogenase
MADGSLCALSVTTGSAEEISRLRFCFEGLSAEGGPNAYQYAQDPWRFTGNGEKNARAVQDILASYVAGPEGYVGQFARFHKALAEDAELPVTLAQARSSLELIAAIYHSAHTGQAVDLPIGPSRPEYSNWRPLEKMARER